MTERKARLRRLAAAVALAALVVAPAQVAGAQSALAAFEETLDARRDELIGVRRDIHRHPDPSGEEARTAGVVAGVLREAGFDVTSGVGGHGVVGVLRGSGSGAGSGPVLAFRADMDAVTSPADDPMEFRSANRGVNHICGHDIHTSVGLALAVGLAGIRDQLRGTIVLVFQPAEETASGANAMIADGLFGASTAQTGGLAIPVPDAIFAYHTAPYEVGQIATTTGTLLPGRDRVRVDIRGDAPLDEIAREIRSLVADLATPGSNEQSRPHGEDFVRVGGARVTGSGNRVVATLTTSGPAASRNAREQLERGLSGLRRPGVEITLDYGEGWVAGAINDPTLVAQSSVAAARILGADNVRETQSVTTIFSEDFGSFLRLAPGAMYFLGVSNSERGWVGMPHTPGYVADEEAIFVGATAMAAILLDLM